MYSGRQRLGTATRILILFSLLVSPNFTSPTALALDPVSEPLQPPPILSNTHAAEPPTPDTLARLGIQRPDAENLTELSQQVAAEVIKHGLPGAGDSPRAPTVGGLPNNLSGKAAQSATLLALLNSSGGTNYRDVMAMANASGREENVADHAQKVADLSTSSLPGGWMLTRAANSAHTFATGFTETVYYYGDSLGNVYVGVDTTGAGQVLTYTVLNLPTLLNAFGSLASDSQIVITGLGVNPVADLSSFARVNGAYTDFDGQIGEILYVAFWDTGSGLRLAANNQVVQSGVLAFPIADLTSPAKALPAIQSELDFPITVGGAFGVAFSVFANVAGLAVDDDGSVYFHQADLRNFTGSNIVKITSVDNPVGGASGWQDRSLATSGILTLATLTPSGGVYGTTSGPVNQVNRFTNYSGASTTFGNVAALAAGPNGSLYAAVARSFEVTDTLAVQDTAGLFTNPPALGPTPAMVISFADARGAFDLCTSPLAGTPGSLPVADGIADAAEAGLTLVPGVNNFRVFALGTGPDVRGHIAGATASNTLQVDFQVDGTIYSGLVVDEAAQVYLVSGGTPAAVGRDPSPGLGEILTFPDKQPFDRRADVVDLRGALPSPTSVGGNVGDGQATRFDYIYFLSPLDQISLTPAGVTGLARGFLLYLNRTRTDLTRFTGLPNGQLQGDDDTDGPIFFEWFDPSHQIAGGDDQNPPFRGDDDDGGGEPPIPGPLNGGFEFSYRQTVTASQTLLPTAWNAFYLNSNGNLTFGVGDTDNTPHADEFLSGPPRLAGAWTDLNPASSAGGYTNTFPVQALGFAGINQFVVRWINVPSFGLETCNSRNTFTIGLYDAGTGRDPNANQPLNPANPIGNNAVPFDLQHGRTDLRFVQEANNLQPAGYRPRPEHSGNACFTYGQMSLLGAAGQDEVLVGVSPGGQLVTTTAGINLSAAALANEAPFPAQLGIAIGAQLPASPYEFFTLGVPASFTVTGDITTTFAAEPVFDLRREGNDPAQSTPVNQPDPNREQVCFYNLDNQTITFDPLDDALISASPVPLTATASSGLPVSFISLTPLVCTVGIGEVNLISLGECIIRAGQAGNASFAPAPFVDRSFLVLAGLYLPLVTK